MKAVEMTIDDESSIYVGGLPYDATEDSVRRVFDSYGEVVAVKIINDRSTRGKCYGFVTFTNPRSADGAINDMNGRTFDGRVLKVNGVKTRGGRSNFSRESFQRYVDRGTNWGRGRDQERDYDRDRDRYRDRNSDLSRERDRSRDRDQEREKGYDHARGRERARDHFLSKDRDQDLDIVDNRQEHGRNRDRDWERDHDLDWEREEELDRTNGHDKSIDKDRDQQLKRQNGFVVNDKRSREISSESCDDYNNQVKVELERSTQGLDELKKETSQMEERLEEKQKLVLDLQKKSKKLEDALIASKKHTSYRQMQLTKLYKCFLHVKDYSERLKSCEEELQTLVDTAMLETDVGDFGLTTGNA
ncbi:DEAD-box ATP-dependent RNA helicase 21 isoform X2 [Alnus glutinosa]|uniref:DEAD-box ATP-dependent RNA helicase 21 isoform X2 n=1 Tax=Alnus glutinosa TaxID=3517 RepID=UPI002D77794A|nr:DEAD-box ATP-dependent RNA helicase 21 isoform X2 [Alnus glutinosa]